MDLELISDYLNELFKKDPQCITNLLRNHVQCNDNIKDDEHCIVGTDKHNNINTISGLGLLNGILSKLDLGKIAVVISEEKDCDGANKILGFTAYNYNIHKNPINLDDRLKEKFPTTKASDMFNKLGADIRENSDAIRRSASKCPVDREPKPTPAPPPSRPAPQNVYILEGSQRVTPKVLGDF